MPPSSLKDLSAAGDHEGVAALIRSAGPKTSSLTPLELADAAMQAVKVGFCVAMALSHS